VKDADGKIEEEFSTSVPSTYRARDEAETLAPEDIKMLFRAKPVATSGAGSSRAVGR